MCGFAVLFGACAARSSSVLAPRSHGIAGASKAAGPAAATPHAAGRKAVYAVSAGSSGSAPTSAPLPPATQRIDDHGPVGSNTFLYLNRTIGKLVVEIDAVHGYEPAASAVSLLRTRLSQVADKPAGIDVLPVTVIPGTVSGDAKHTFMENTERKYRVHYSTARAIVLYVLYSDNDTGNSIGAAYSSSAFAVFKQSIESAATPLVSAEEIEDSVIVHEMGHVLALVNIGYTSPRDHEDPNHPGHSKNPGSVMYWAVDNVGVVGLLGGHMRPPTTFDADDLADLRDLRDGKLK